MTSPVVLITGANGEIGRSLVESLAQSGRYQVVTLDLTPVPDSMLSLIHI